MYLIKKKKTEASNPSHTELKTLVIRILKELSENFNKKLVNIKMYIKTTTIIWKEMRYTITKMKNTPEGINIKLDKAKDLFSSLESKVT